MSKALFEPYDLGLVRLSNRIVMAPLTRRRAENSDLSPNDLMCEYYGQRASAGLIISEGSQISPRAYGYSHSPGCYSPVQIQAWKKVTDTVHKRGGKIFLQLWHVGPFSHRLLQPENQSPLAASIVTPEGDVLTSSGRVPYEAARPMTHDEIEQTISDFGQAAKNAMLSGFDGVEVHGAHAYLIDQFIMDGTNKRIDVYGGSIENRSRLLFRILDEVLMHLPSEKMGLRLSPGLVKGGMSDANPQRTFTYIIEKLNEYKLAYLHLSEMMTPKERLSLPGNSIVPYFRKIYKGTLISCGGHSLESANRMIRKGEADMIAFGKPFISNPDLVFRLAKHAPIEPFDTATFYHGGAKGYTDYPVYTSNG